MLQQWGEERWRAIRLELLSSALWLEFKLCSEPYETDTQVASYILCDLARTFGFDAVVLTESGMCVARSWLRQPSISLP